MRKLTAAEGSAIFFLAICCNLTLQLFGSIIIACMTVIPGLSANFINNVTYVLMILFQVAFFAVVFIYTKVKRVMLAYSVKKVKWYVWLLSIVCGFTCLFCFSTTANWVVIILDKIGYVSTASVPLETPSNIILCIIAVVFMAPVCEELVFRGALLSGLVKKFGVVPSVLLSGLAFMLMHMNVEQTIYQFLLGCTCAYLAICAKSVIPSMIVHGVSNATVLILNFIPMEGGDTVSASVILAVSTVLLVSAGGAGIYFLGRVIRKKSVFATSGGIIGRVDKTEVGDTNTANATETVGAAEAVDTAENTSLQVESVQPAKKVNPMIASLWEEDKLDEADYAAKRRIRLLGKYSHVVTYAITAGVCVAVLVMTFAAGIFAGLI